MNYIYCVFIIINYIKIYIVLKFHIYTAKATIVSVSSV